MCPGRTYPPEHAHSQAARAAMQIDRQWDKHGETEAATEPHRAVAARMGHIMMIFCTILANQKLGLVQNGHQVQNSSYQF